MKTRLLILCSVLRRITNKRREEVRGSDYGTSGSHLRVALGKARGPDLEDGNRQENSRYATQEDERNQIVEPGVRCLLPKHRAFYARLKILWSPCHSLVFPLTSESERSTTKIREDAARGNTRTRKREMRDQLAMSRLLPHIKILPYHQPALLFLS
jgi:hypothetical protein